MANPVCGAQSLIDGGKCLKQLDRHRRRAAKVYFMSLQLAAIGGTAYTLGPAGTLNTAATAYCGLLTDRDMINVAWLVIESRNAAEAGATVPSTIDGIATAIKCLDTFPDWKLDQMELLLRCQLGRADGYPQA